MKEFLKKIKLLDHLKIELEIQKSDFVNRLKGIVKEGSVGIMTDGFDAFSSSKKEYKGEVNSRGFKLKRRKKFFDFNKNIAVAKGTYLQKDNVLVITAEINGFHKMMIPFYIFILLFYSVFAFGFLSNGLFIEQPIMPPFILLHGAFMFGLPYFFMRRSTSRLKHELEREFYFITK